MMSYTNIFGIHVQNKNTCLDPNNPHICIGWSSLGDVSSCQTKAELEAAYDHAYPNASKSKRGNELGQLKRFILDMNIGDLIVFREGKGVYFGEVTSDYYWTDKNKDDDSDYQNVRDVKWLKGVSVEMFSTEFKNSLGAAMTFFALDNYRDYLLSFLDDSYLDDNESFQRLKKAKDIDYLKYDGSYELVHTVIKEYENVDVDLIDTKDLDLIYFSTIGTWKSSFKNKKDRTNASHLSIESQEKICKLIDELEKRTQDGYYAHFENGEKRFGMFGTGFGNLKVSKQNSQKIIQMLLKMLEYTEDEQYYSLIENTLTSEIKGMKNGVLSTILHCLNPNVFPIMNGNQGAGTKVYTNLGIVLNSENEITHYVENARRIKAFRDKYFTFKNYRVFDLDAFNLIEKQVKLEVDDSGVYSCNTGITSDDWVYLIDDFLLTSEKIRELLVTWYEQENHEASCKQIADVINDGSDYNKYNGIITQYCKKISNKKKIIINGDDDAKYYPILMNGRYSTYNGQKVFNWILKEEVVQALEEMALVAPPVVPESSVDTYTEEDFLEEVFISSEELSDITQLLKRKKNIILQGSPGVGKSFMANRLAYAFMGCKDKDNIENVQFHQSYSYEDFIYGYQPIDGKFELVPGIFYSFCKKAEKSDKPFFFIIDEINRGNLSKIFGELLMLIESDKRGKHLTLSHTKEPFSVPENVYIIGMMNTADRSLSIIDYALRRRFSFVKINPAFDTDQFKKLLLDNGTSEKMADTIITKFDNLNLVIKDDASLGKDFQIGHSYFCESNTPIDEKLYKDIIKYDIQPILEEYWFDNEPKLQQELAKLAI